MTTIRICDSCNKPLVLCLFAANDKGYIRYNGTRDWYRCKFEYCCCEIPIEALDYLHKEAVKQLTGQYPIQKAMPRPPQWVTAPITKKHTITKTQHNNFNKLEKSKRRKLFSSKFRTSKLKKCKVCGKPAMYNSGHCYSCGDK